MKALKPWWLLSLRIKTLGNKTQILDKSLVKKKKKEAEEEEEEDEKGDCQCGVVDIKGIKMDLGCHVEVCLTYFILIIFIHELLNFSAMSDRYLFLT